MFITQEDNERLISFIENSQFEEAKDLIVSNKSKGQCVYIGAYSKWVFNQYIVSENPDNWLRFYEYYKEDLSSNLISINLPKLLRDEKLINKLLEAKDNKNITNYLARLFKSEPLENFGKIVNKIAPSFVRAGFDREIAKSIIQTIVSNSNAPYVDSLFTSLLEHSYLSGNLILLKELVSLGKEDDYLLWMNYNSLNIKYNDKIEKLSKLEDDVIEVISYELREFIPGKINTESALLTLAQIHDRKTQYEFNPSLITSEEECREFFETLKNTSIRPIRERFIINGDPHWISGDIEITSSGEVRVFVIDSLGELDAKCLDFSYTPIIAEVFKDEDVSVWYTDSKRQCAGSGCSIYAIDDVTHLYGIEAILRKNLFEYLKEHTTSSEKKGPLIINKCHLPLSLERTTQNKRAKDNLDQRLVEENYPPINKKGNRIETFYSFFNKDDMNYRLNQQLDKMRQYNIEFLKKPENIDSLVEKKSKFTIEGTKERISLKEQEVPLRMNL